MDVRRRVITRGGHAVPLAPKTFDLLVLLVQSDGRAVSKQELTTALWPATFVEEANLSFQISALRKALGESGSRWIETLPRHGYRFVATVSNLAAEAEAPVEHPHRNRRATIAIALVLAFVLIGATGAGLYRFLDRSRSATNDPGVGPAVVPVTRFPGHETQPTFSPDGKQIAFAWDDGEEKHSDIYVKLLGTDGLLPLTSDPAPDHSPVWSPDGRHIAFMREGERGGIYLVPAVGGGGERQLAEIFPTGVSNRGAYYQFGRNSLAYSPDGKHLAVADITSAGKPFSIFLLDIETRKKWPLTFPPAASVGDDSPAFSPDGQTLAFARLMAGGREIWVVPVKGGDARPLTAESTVRPGSFTDGLAWTRDGREIVFASNRTGSFLLWRVPVSGGVARRIDVDAQNVIGPAISNDGNRLAWVHTSLDRNIWRVEVPRTAGQHPTPTRLIASTAGDSNPQYSPDGERIVFSSTRSGPGELWVSDRDGRNPMRLTNIGGAVTGTPRWSPNGRQIAFDSMKGSNRDIYIVSSNGGQHRQFTTDSAEDTCPSWSRDGRWIYFGSGRSGSLQIWKMPSAGGQAVQVTRHGGFEGFESPNGKHFYYAKGRDVPGIWRVPVEGGPETLVVDHHGAGFWRSWAVTEEGIYFVTAEMPPRPIIEFFSFGTGEVRQVTTLDRPVSARVWGFSVSPDRRWILYTQSDQSSSDIMLMEGFLNVSRTP
jgi:Tol biopolymer transport system component/DNA-binding winged helix-turn-helix (wHTH) protein